MRVVMSLSCACVSGLVGALEVILRLRFPPPSVPSPFLPLPPSFLPSSLHIARGVVAAPRCEDPLVSMSDSPGHKMRLARVRQARI